MNWNLSETEMRILAMLEEAGNEEMTTVLRTVQVCHGDKIEIERFKNALSNLHAKSLIEFGSGWDSTTSKWIVFSKEKSNSELSVLGKSLLWSTEYGTWIWTPNKDELEAYSTDKGNDLANKILDKYGWEFGMSKEDYDCQD